VSFANSPSCLCCECPTIGTDDFSGGIGSWTERVGDWGIVGGNLAIDHDGLIVFDTVITPGDVFAEVDAKSLDSNVKLSLVFWESDDEHDSGGVEIDYLGTNSTLGRMQIESTTGGVTSEVGNTSANGPAGRDTWVTIRVCVRLLDTFDTGTDTDILSLEVETSTGTRTLERCIVPVSTTKIGIRVDGIGSGSGDPATGIAQFRNFSIYGTAEASIQCEECACNGCSGEHPAELQVQITTGHTGLGNCCFDLAAATYVLTRLNGCFWTYTNATISIQATLVIVSGTSWKITIVYSCGGGARSATYTRTFTTKPDCASWSGLETTTHSSACATLGGGVSKAVITAL